MKLYTFGPRTHKLLDDRTVTVQFPPASERTQYEFRTISMLRLWRLHDNCTIFVQYQRGLRMAMQETGQDNETHAPKPVATYDARKTQEGGGGLAGQLCTDCKTYP